MRKLFFVLPLFFSTLLGCSYAMEEVGLFKISPSFLQLKNKKISFEVVKEFSLKSCLQCHTSLHSADRVLAMQEKIIFVINRNSMPPASSGYRPLDACQKMILETWLDDQRQNRSAESAQKVGELAACRHGASPVEEVKPVDFANLELNFANVTKEILAKKCLHCHLPENSKGTVLDSVTMMQAQNVINGKAENSKLYQVVIPGMNKRFMPPTRSGIPPLTTAEADYLKRWIDSLPPSEFDF